MLCHYVKAVKKVSMLLYSSYSIESKYYAFDISIDNYLEKSRVFASK